MEGLGGLSAEKRARILEAALAEFLDKGFSEARMDCISTRAAVSKRTVYKHFESKENLFHAIVQLLADRIAVTLDIVYDPARPIRDQLVDLGWAEGRLLISPDVISMFRMIIVEAMREPELATGMQCKFDKTSCVATFLRAADADGTLSIDDPQTGAEQFIAMLKARAFWPVIFGADILNEADIGEVIENTVAMMLARYGVSDAS